MQLIDSSGETRLHLRASCEIAVVQVEANRRSFEAQLTGYFVSIQDDLGVELLAYHWHSSGLSRIRTPHLHVSFEGNAIDARLGRRTLSRIHLPTGVVVPASIVQMLIEELRITPIRSDWRTVLKA